MSVKVESVDDQSKVDEVVMDPISSILEPPENISGGTFVSRVYLAVGRRYIASMRRSVQGIVLYEADRCLSDKYDALKPFQRKQRCSLFITGGIIRHCEGSRQLSFFHPSSSEK